jgi:hypothetical protein
MTPDSVISRYRSLPSRVRSPTPPNAEEAAVFLGDVADQLLNEHRFADAGATEQADLAALGERGQQVDGLQTGLELFRGRHLLLKRRRETVNRQSHFGVDRSLAVDRIAQQVEDPTQ